MRRGRPLKPTISIESVVAALKMLDYNTEALATSQVLENLAFVRENLQKSGRPSAEGIRSLVLRGWLVDCITSTVNGYRSYFDLEPAGTDSTRAIILEQLQTTFETSSQMLKGWHLLFVRYVRPELGFGIAELAESVHTHTRSLQRYQDRAIVALRDKIIEAEWAARNRSHMTELRQAIPVPFIELIGRDNETSAMIEYVETSNGLPILITGDHGSGKSSVASQVAYYLIAEHTLDHVLWLSLPESIQFIQNRIWDILDPNPAQIQWNKLLGDTRLLLVLDGVDQIGAGDNEWQELFHGLKEAIVLVTGSDSDQMPVPCYRVVLNPLDELDALKLIKNYTSQIDEKSVIPIVQAARGNPARLLAGCELLLDGVQDIETISAHLQGSLLDTMTVQENLELFIACLSSQRPHPAKSMRHPVSETTYYVLQAHYEAQMGFQERVVQEITSLIETQGNNLHIQQMVLDIAVVSWVRLPVDVLTRILKCVAIDRLSYSQLQQWRYIFARTNLEHADNIELAYRHGIILRKSHRYSEAQAILEDLLQRTGRTGDFSGQLEILLELGVIAQMTGEFTVAKEIYERISALAGEYAADDMSTKVQLQLARLAIEYNDQQVAIQHLAQNDMADATHFTLLAEAKLLDGDLEFVIVSAKSYLLDRHLPPTIRASLCTLLGRASLRLNEISQAIAYFNQAVVVTEQYGDLFDIGRARSNLCSAEIMQWQASSDTPVPQAEHDLEQRLESTAHLQSRIYDTVGLEATLRTLTYVRQSMY